MKYILQAGAMLLIAAIVLPCFAAESKDEKQEVKKADPAKKDDKDAKKDDKDANKDDAKKDDKDDKKGDAKKDAKDDKDAKKDAAKKDDKDDKDPKKDAAKKDAAKKDAAKKKDEHLNTDKMIKAGEVTGKIASVEVSKRSIRLAVDFSIPRDDPISNLNAANTQVAVAQNALLARNALVQYQNLVGQAQQSAMQAQQALAKKDKNGFNQNMNQANQYQAQALQYQIQAAQYRAMASQQAAVGVSQAASRADTVRKEIVIGTTDDVQVRLLKPAQVYDDKGKPRRLTAKELKEAKGDDPKLPGYQADFANLREEQIVTMTLVKNKEKPKIKPVAGKKDPDLDDLLGDNLPKASRIMIVAEPPPSK